MTSALLAWPSSATETPAPTGKVIARHCEVLQDCRGENVGFAFKKKKKKENVEVKVQCVSFWVVLQSLPETAAEVEKM